jgi:hypothetical protein
MPETLRALVGNGSIPPPVINCRPVDVLQLSKRKKAADAEMQNFKRPEKKPVSHVPFSVLHNSFIISRRHPLTWLTLSVQTLCLLEHAIVPRSPHCALFW